MSDSNAAGSEALGVSTGRPVGRMGRLLRRANRAGAVLPDALQRKFEPAISALLQAVLRNGRARDVAAEPLELFSVPPIHALPCVQVDPAHLSDGIGVVATRGGGRGRG